MEYNKSSAVDGAWVKASEVKSGTTFKITGEVKPVEGEYGVQDVGKVVFKGESDEKNLRFNKTSLNAMIDAFGNESKEWVNQVLTAVTEKALVGGKRVTILYAIPEGYELSDGADRVEIIKVDGESRPEVDDDEIPVVDDEIPFS